MGENFTNYDYANNCIYNNNFKYFINKFKGTRMKRLQSFLTLLVLLLVSVSASWAATLTVGPGKTYATIQAAVTAANGGDIIEVYSATYQENVNIPGGKNGLIVREAAGETAILDGTAVGNPKVAFRISSDNVTIQGFTIQNYYYSGATNVAFGQAQRGVGIESIDASSQHTFTGNTIIDCNFGIYVREGNNITVTGNTINDFRATTFVGTWNQQGGVGIAFLSGGIAMDGNVITNNSLDNNGTTGTYGIVYGRIGANVGADFVQIKNNSVVNGTNPGFFGYGIFNIKGGESVDFSGNISNGNDAALDIFSTNAVSPSDNEDVTFTNNKFEYTNSTTEVRASAYYSGEKLWELMVTNGNLFSKSSDLSNAIASLVHNADIITVNGAVDATSKRYIRNNLDAAITDAEAYINFYNLAGRVYVTNGTYIATATATVNGISNPLLIFGQSLAAKINSTAPIMLDIQSDDVTVDPLTFEADLNLNNVVAINTTGANTVVKDIAFTSINNGSNSYKGIVVNDAATVVDINNNTFIGAIMYAVEYESTGGTIECNTFNADVVVAASAAIYAHDIDGGFEGITSTIIANTFEGNFANSINVDLTGTVGSNIAIGQANLGNTFTSQMATTNAINVTQTANNEVAINYNKFDVTFADYIVNNGAFNLNAGFNYFNVVAPFATNVAAMIAGTGAANVSWLPIYTNGTDQDLTTCGFQPLLTSLWTPVYTATDFTGVNSEITAAGNEYFLTVEAALADANTTTGDRDNVFLYLTGTYAETNAAVLDFNSANISIAAAPAQPANSNTRPSPKISSTFAGAILDLNFNNILVDKIEFISGTNAAYYPINVGAAVTQDVTVTNCIFNVNGATNPDAAILFANAANLANVTINYNEFTVGNSNYAVDFGIAAVAFSNVEVDSNNVYCADAITTAIRFNNVDDLDVTYNNFEAGLAFVGNAGSAALLDVNIFGNTFLPSISSVPVAIDFAPGAGTMDFINIEQNKIHQFGIGINIAAAASANVNGFTNWTINENYFANMNDGITIAGFVPAGILDATNNHWQTNYGPQAYANAPAWHDEAGNPIIANSYGKLFNDNAGVNVVPLVDATYIQFVPWWNDIQNTPGTYTGTTFAPIENDEAPIEYFASLNFAIDATATGFNIHMQDVPDWANPGQTVYYLEANTVENASKNLTVWGQPFFPPTTKIATVGNDATDNMFYVDNGTFNVNFLEFTYDQSSAEDITAGLNYDFNGIGTIDWCYINDLRGTAGLNFGVILSDATANVTVTNSVIQNLDGPSQVIGIGAYDGSTLAVDNTVFNGRNDLGSAISYEMGIYIGGVSNVTVTNSYFTDYLGNGGIGAAILANNNSGFVIGNINIYQNIIEGNNYGLYIGENQVNDNYSSANIYNNIIRTNEIGLRYEPNVASTLTVENNSWGSNNGPRSEAQAGSTQENTFNETAQGNAVVDGNANSTIDFHPWRRIVTGDDLATMIAGPRFAPIIRTNAANIAQGLYSNFNDAIRGLAANQKIYAYSEVTSTPGVYSQYSENIVLENTLPTVISNNQIIGKLAPISGYSVGWIISPNAPIFANAWTNGTQGADTKAPTIIYGGVAAPLLDDNGSNFAGLSMRGFVFNTQATTVPYAGNPTNGIIFNLNTDDVTFSYNTFLADANDRSISWGNGQHNNWDITYNKHVGTGSGYFAYIESQTTTNEITIEFNDLDGGAVFVDKQGAGSITNMSISKNRFANTSGAITLDGTAAAGFITNLDIRNNRFAATNTYAFIVDASADDNIVTTSWTQDVEFINNEVLIAPSAQIVVGFANATPLVSYSEEFTATCNWWGSAFGPTFALNPGGNGARVSEGVFFAPWLSGNLSSTTFEFTPTSACNVGERVWVNADGVVTNKTIKFPSLQWAVQHATVVAGTNDHIFVSDAYNNVTNDAGTSFVQENITIDWNAFDITLHAESKPELKINGNFEFDGTNAYDLYLGSNLRITGNLTVDNIGALGQFILEAKNLVVEGNITDASYGVVVTNGDGFLVKENVVTGGINRFPVAFTELGTYTPAQFVANASGFLLADNNVLKVRVENYAVNPGIGVVDIYGMGEKNHNVQNVWTVDFDNNSSVVSPNIAMTLRFMDDNLNDAGFTSNKTTSYAAYWDLNPPTVPQTPQWRTFKSKSSWNGSDGVQVTNLDLIQGTTEWALFYGSTSYALSDAPTQAKNIQWIGGDDRNLQFQWQRNGTDNQYYAIMAVKGSMTAPPADPFAPVATGTGTSSPWVASATSRNFSDGYVDNVTTPSWTAGLFHNLAATPADVKVLKVGKYTGGLTENVTVTDLDQGTYYTFFVANFNYGNGLTAIANMETGADGMANYHLGNGGALNPRTRKTQPAVYMTLDVPSTTSTAAIVYGTTLPNNTDVTDLYTLSNHWRRNNVLTGNTVVRNNYNLDALTGGNYAQLCNTGLTTPFNVGLFFKGYGNNGGTNWGIKYSENNNTITFTTPLVNSTTTRSRSIATKYYLVSAYDGDGKVAALYDNLQDLQVILDAPTALLSSITPNVATCAGNAATLTTSPNSIPNATFVTWEVSSDNGTTWTASLASAGYAPLSATNNLTLSYADNGKLVRAKYQSNSVCNWDGSQFNRDEYTTPILIQVYDATLTGSNPANVETCEDTPSVQFVSNEGTLVSPNNLTLLDWQVSTDNGLNFVALAGLDYSVSTVGSPSVSTLTVSNISTKDNYQFRARWTNGDCATPVATSAATLNVVEKPVITPLVAPADVCINQPINITATQTATLPFTVGIQWQYSTNGITYNNLTNGVTADVTVAGATTNSLTITPHNLNWDNYYVKVVYTHTENTTTCTTESNAVQIGVMPTPVFNAIPDQTVCQNTNMSVTAVDANPTSWSGNIVWYHTSVAPANMMTTGNTYFGSTVTISGASAATFTINNAALAWDGITVIAYNNNGACAGQEEFVVNIDEAPTVGTATVTAGEVCEGDPVVYTVTYTPAATGTVVWYYNGNPVTSGTSVTSNAFNNATIVTAAGTSTLTLADVTVAIDGDPVYAEVDNGTCAVVTSNSVSADIETIPVAPATVGAQDIFSHRFNVTWTGVANADDYDVQVSELADFSVLDANVNVAAPAVTWTGMANCVLDPAKTYYFRVRANNQCGEGPWKQSNIVTLDPTVTSIAYTTGDGLFGNVEVGTSSPADTYRITYYQLDAGLQVVVPAEYEIKPTGSVNWLTGTVDLTPYLTLYLGTPGSPLTLNVQVRYTPTVCGLVTGNLTHTTLETCAGVTEMPAVNYVSVSGTGVVAAPTTPANNGIVMENVAGTFSATWTNGNGTNRLVILSQSSSLGATPANNTPYSIGNTIGNGTVVAVLANPTAAATISVPVDGNNYFVHVWEYNACGLNTEIYAASGYNFQPYYLKFGTTIPDQLSGTESGNVTLDFTRRNGSKINNPFATFNVTLQQNPVTGSFSTNPVPVQIVNGTDNTVFKFTWTESCGVEDGYLTATATNVNGTQSNTFNLNVTAPEQQSNIIVWVGVPCAASTTFKWTNGDGAGRLVVVRQGALPIAPTNFQVYSTNSNWSARGASNLLGDDTYAMGAVTGTNNSITITNLELGKLYYFRVYEYNGCVPQLRKYLTTNSTFNPRSRTINCKEGNDLSDIVVDRFNAVSNSGKGIISFNTLYEANISGFELRRINVTDEEMDGMLIGSYMNNAELVAAGNTMTGKSYSFNDNSSLLEVGKTYLYQLTAIAFDGTRIDVAETELTINDDIYSGISEFSMSPVTVTNSDARFDLTVNKQQNVTITMYDVTGQKVASIANDVRVNRGTQQFSTNIQNVTNGTYMIVVESAEGISSVQKFQIVR